jgi:hypothetical protein
VINGTGYSEIETPEEQVFGLRGGQANHARRLFYLIGSGLYYVMSF